MEIHGLQKDIPIRVKKATNGSSEELSKVFDQIIFETFEVQL